MGELSEKLTLIKLLMTTTSSSFSYRYRMAYIAAQGPLPETAEDFWRMLWEHNSTIVVMLTKLKEMGKEKCTQYWPDSRSVRYQYYVVDPVAEYNMPQYKLREFKVWNMRSFVEELLIEFIAFKRLLMLETGQVAR